MIWGVFDMSGFSWLQKIGLLFLVVTSVLATAGFVTFATYSNGGITFYQPSTPGQVYQQGQPLVLSVVTPLSDATLIVYVHNPQGKIVYQGTFTTNSTGGFTGTLFTFEYPQFIAGNYTILVIVESTSVVAQTYQGSIYVIFKPGVITLDVQVVSNTGVPLQGATVTITNVSSKQVVFTGVTNSSGMVTFATQWIPSVPNVLNISASLSGYETNYTVISASQPGTYFVKLVLTKIALQLEMYAVYASSVNVGYIEYSPVLFGTDTIQGSHMTVQVQVFYAGMPVSTATVAATFEFAGKTPTTITGVYTGSKGIYNITFIVPVVNTLYPIVGNLYITASYQGQSQTIQLGIVAYPNYTAEIVMLEQYIVTLNNLLKSLNSTVSSLETEVSALSTAVSSLQSELSTINATLTKVNSTVASLSTEVSTLSSQVSSLSTQVSSLSSNVSSLKSDITTINSEISTLNTEISNLGKYLAGNVSTINTAISGLNGSISTLKSEIANANSRISSLSTIVYGAIAVGIIGLILAVIALVMVMRRIR